MGYTVPDEVYTLANRAAEAADEVVNEDLPLDPDAAWRQGYDAGYLRAIAHMSSWVLGDGPADHLRERTDELGVDL